MINVLAQGHNTVTPVRLEPAAPRSWVKHSTTEPLRSLSGDVDKESYGILLFSTWSYLQKIEYNFLIYQEAWRMTPPDFYQFLECSVKPDISLLKRIVDPEPLTPDQIRTVLPQYAII